MFENRELKRLMPDSAIASRKPGRRITILVIPYVAEISGSWRVLSTLIDRLDPKTFRIVLLLPDSSELNWVAPSYVRLRTVRIPKLTAALRLRTCLNLIALDTPAMFRLRRVIIEEQADIVHCNGLPNMFGALAAALSPAKLVWHIHELEFRPQFVFRLLVWIAQKLSDKAVCVSAGVLELFRGAANAALIYNGIDISMFSPANAFQITDMRTRLGLSAEDFVVTQLGRVVPIKGTHYFVDLAEAFVKRRIKGAERVKFMIVGGGIEGHEQYFKTALKRIQTGPARSQIVYLPEMKDPSQLLKCTDILVQSSTIKESFGLTLVEAMAAGKPVISSPFGGPTELVRDGVDGFLIGPTEIDRRLDVLLDLFLDERKRIQMGERGKKRVEVMFSADRMVQEFSALYSTLSAP